MRLHYRAAWWAPLIAVSLAVGCTNGTVHLQPVSPGGSTPTYTPTPASSGATATPTAGATATPTHAATATPTPGTTAIPTSGPTGSGLGCTAAVAPVPGNYLSINTEGQITGSTYLQDVNAFSDWEFDAYTVPAATPVPTATPTATATPTSTPTPVPTATPTPNLYTIYEGIYTVTSFSGTSIPSGGSTAVPYTVPAQTGCFEMLLEQPAGGTIGQARPRAAVATPNPADNAFGDGEPNTTADADVNEIATGSITSLQINNLSASKQTGSGTFTLDSGATGTITIQGAESETFGIRRALERMQQRKARLFRSSGH